jgi:hypothetical protein
MSQPRPLSTVPFRRNGDFVNNSALDYLWSQKYSSASRIALVGMGGGG